MHAHGAAIIAQLSHYGSKGASDGSDDLRVLWSASAIRSPTFNETPKAMEREDIAEAIEAFVAAAQNAKAAGFDGVEIHFAHGYLFHQFLSPLFNVRTDEYGGPLEDRLRFPLEVMRHVGELKSPTFVVGARVSMDDYAKGGLGLRDGISVAQTLADEGLIDYLNVTAGMSNMGWAVGPPQLEDGWLLEHQPAMKAAVGRLPTIAVGGLVDPEQAEELVASGQADLVALIRAQIADPEWARTRRARGGLKRSSAAYAATRAAWGARRAACRSPASSTRLPGASGSSESARWSQPSRRVAASSWVVDPPA